LADVGVTEIDSLSHDPGQMPAINMGCGEICNDPVRFGYRHVLHYCPFVGIEPLAAAMESDVVSRRLIAPIDDELDFVVWKLTKIPDCSRRSMG
jgi:hypothetical protein